MANNLERQHPDRRGAGQPVSATDYELFEAGPAQPPAASRPARPSAPFAGRLSLQSFLRYKWSMAIVFVVLAVPGATLAWMMQQPVYQSYTDIEVPPVVPRLAFKNESNGVMPFYNQHLRTQVAKIRNPKVLARVFDPVAVRVGSAESSELSPVMRTEWFRKGAKTLFGTPIEPVDRLREEISVRPLSGTQLLRISIETSNPRDAAVIVNSVANAYISVVATESDSDEDIILDKLREKRSAFEARISELQSDIERIRYQFKTSDPKELVTQQGNYLETLRQEQSKLRRDAQLVAYQLDQLEAAEAEAGEDAEDASSATGDGRPEDAENNAIADAEGSDESEPTTQPVVSLDSLSEGEIPREYQDDDQFRLRWFQWQNARHEVKLAAQHLGERNPRLIELRDNAAHALRLLTIRQNQLDDALARGDHTVGFDNTPASRLAALTEQKVLLAKRDELLQSLIDEQERDIRNTLEATNNYENQTNELNTEREVAKIAKLAEAQKTFEKDAPQPIRIVSQAIPSSVPNNEKKRVLFTAMAVFLAAGISFGLAFVRVLASSQLRQTEDVIDSTQSPILGFLPLVPENGTNDPLTPSLQAEYCRMLRTALFERLSSISGNTLLITSAGPGAGKSTVAALLARSFAHAGRKVLLVDTDLRKGTLAKRLNVRTSPGLVEVLCGEADCDAALIAGDDRSPDLLTAGHVSEAFQYELLAGKQFVSLLARWREGYDIVVLDGPPLLPIADARILASHVDGTLLVVRESHCRRREVTEAVDTLSAASWRFFGSVFLGSRRSQRYYYPSSYADYVYAGPQYATSDAVDIRAGGST